MQFNRQQYLDLMSGHDCSRQMFVELFGPLIGLEEEWAAQGATQDELDMIAFDWDYVDFIDCGANAFFLGKVTEPKILEENDNSIIAVDSLGRKTKLCKGSSTLPLPLDWPVKDMQSWEKIKPLFKYSDARIDEKSILHAKKRQQEDGYIVTANIFGAFDTIRMLMGDENACIVYYTDPDLALNILNTITEMTLKVFEQTLKKIHVDQLMTHEDMAGKSGPLVGPKQIEEFYKPYYHKVWDLFESHGTPIFQMDSDGNIENIIDVLMECGINSVYPVEPAAGMDIVKLRKKYGNQLMMFGGIDKHVLRGTKEDIRRELEYKMQPIMQQGGMVFGLDHRIPNGTPLENYRYYVDLGRELLGIEPRTKNQKGWQRMAFCGESIT
ncbi:methylcobalamin:coenzyme M methyltransferase [Limihaloglobus sulfuriphilus]|uniref:Methylcobalamin:coenzyme M methyltransferase n=2 Tax=Limihaloglobus sulfuriphilus TaxID=1851148 RepID=A0A1Q2ME65_9BACT|nr:methylcobalamin:coenzyme M methyltransferase [Limihaloglobus sulfuriphilus]